MVHNCSITAVNKNQLGLATSAMDLNLLQDNFNLFQGDLTVLQDDLNPASSGQLECSQLITTVPHPAKINF
jgi:hypothetical protein